MSILGSLTSITNVNIYLNNTKTINVGTFWQIICEIIGERPSGVIPEKIITYGSLP